MIGVFYGRNLTEERSCHEKENRNAIVEIKRELNQFTIYYSVIVTLNDKKLAQITKLFLLITNLQENPQAIRSPGN
ncbi:Uncharacterised protein [Klebsiella pneumoniae]|uniref:Uncharacterized protein n=1 Tax=Klebsiella pneumoniae TaxID=573 RepID=A0A377VT80_KLEPN|nr:Uncharacterised protein [Klebsiella pneumoniae]